MSSVLIGAAVGAIAGITLPKRVVSIEGIYVDSGQQVENIIMGICISNECNVSYVDHDGTSSSGIYSNGTVFLVKSLVINSGRVFALVYRQSGLA